MKTKLLNYLRIIFSVGLMVYIIFFQVDLQQLINVMSEVKWGYLIVAVILMVFGVALRAVRWQVLLKAIKIKAPLGKLINLYFIGGFFNVFLPTGFGGDAVRMAELARESGKTPEAIGTTLVDRATGLWVLFVLALLTLPLSFSLLPMGWATIIAVITLAGVVGGWLVMASPLIPWLGSKVTLPGQEKLERFYRSTSQLGYAALGKACLVSLIFNIMLIGSNILIAYSLDVDQPIGIFFLFTPLISVSLILPLSVGGLGVREQTYVSLFSTVGLSASVSVAMSLLNYTVTYLVIGLIGGGLYLLAGARGLVVRDTVNPNQF